MMWWLVAEWRAWRLGRAWRRRLERMGVTEAYRVRVGETVSVRYAPTFRGRDRAAKVKK